MALIGRCFSISLVSTFGAFKTLKTGSTRADLAVTFAGRRSLQSSSSQIFSVPQGLRQGGHCTLGNLLSYHIYVETRIWLFDLQYLQYSHLQKWLRHSPKLPFFFKIIPSHYFYYNSLPPPPPPHLSPHQKKNPFANCCLWI